MDLIKSFKKHLDKIIDIQTGMTSLNYIKEIRIGLNELEENSKIFKDKNHSITSEIIHNTHINPLFVEFKDYQFGLNQLINGFEWELKNTKDENVFHNISKYKSILYLNLGVVNEVIKYLEANDPNPSTETIEQRFKKTIDNLKKINAGIQCDLNTNTTLTPQLISEKKIRIKNVICETFKNIDKKGWQYAFDTEEDYNLFTDLLINFFEYKPYTLPETIIKLKRSSKTKVASVLGEIHKELSFENKLSTDIKYFELIKVLSHFEKETRGDLYKALTR